MSFIRRLSTIIKKSPILTGSLQAGGLTCVGDLVSQKIVEKKESFDFVRNARFGLIGFCMVGPVLRTWYGFLDRRVVMKNPKMTGFAKMLADQCLMAPVFLANFVAVNSILQGNSWTKVKSDVTSNYKDILVTNYQIWPLVQLANFNLVPLQYQLVVVQLVAILWNSYLSWKTNQTPKEK